MKRYLQLQKRYLALNAVEKVTCLLSAVAVAVVCLMLGAMVLFFALYALAWWAGALLGSVATGFIIVAVLLMVMAIVFYCHRQQWVVQPLARLMAGLFLDNDYEEEEESDEKVISKPRRTEVYPQAEEYAAEGDSHLADPDSRPRAVLGIARGKDKPAGAQREPVCGSWNGHLRRCAHRTASGAGSTLSVRAQEAKIDRQNHKRRPGGASSASWSLCFPGVEGNSGKPGSAIPLPKKLRRSDSSARCLYEGKQGKSGEEPACPICGKARKGTVALSPSVCGELGKGT